MKRTNKPKTFQCGKGNQKISTFFAPTEVKKREEVVDIINVSDSVDLIEDSPEQHKHICKNTEILEDLTNCLVDGPLHSTPLDKKRKSIGKYPDDIPDMLVPFPFIKKACTAKNNLSVVALADLSKEEFDSFQGALESNANSKSAEKLIKSIKSEDKSPFMSPKLKKQHTPDLKKSFEKKSAKSPRKTPIKLFAKSPNVNEFNVEVIKNFIKITPSKSQNKDFNNKSPIRSVEKKQISILNYASPSTSQKSMEAQSDNEKTPIQSTNSKLKPKTPMSSRVKVKLDFTLSETLVTIKKATADESVANISTKNVNICVATKPQIINGCEEFKDLLNDSWEDNFQFTLPQYSLDLSTSQHCKVLDVTSTKTNIVLTLQSTQSEDKAMCTLSDFWANIKINVGNIVHISAVKIEANWCINNNHGLLVYEPDKLISSTSVVGSIFCQRKCVLKDRYAGFDGSNKAMLLGTIVHSLLQTCLKMNIRTKPKIEAIVKNMLTSKDIIKQLYESSITKTEIEHDLKEYIPRIITFMQQYLNKNAFNDKSVNWKGKIDEIADIEENIWSPELGVKGKIDVTIRAGNSIMPLELKTGKASMSLEHRAQVILYIMMMKKLGYNVDSGLLLYLREGTLRDIAVSDREQRDIIILRNELAYYLTQMPQIPELPTELDNTQSTHASLHLCDDPTLISAKLPPPINHHSACNHCEYNVVCCAYLKHEKHDLQEFKLLRKIQAELLTHLHANHIKYFQHFSALLALEGSGAKGKQIKDIYTKTPEERKKNSGCIAYVKIKDVAESSGLSSTTFVMDASAGPIGNLLLSGIGESHYVVVSMDKRPAVAAGLVAYIDTASIRIELDRNLLKKYPDGIYHLDTYESSSINTFNFTNLSLLMEPTDRAYQLRKLIIDKDKPTFKKTLPADVGRKSIPILKRMNKMQQKAVIKALAANDYLLIKGMPGTGKTATVVALVQFLVELNQSVIITSHTHSAVDNVCLRLEDCGVKVLRLGADTRIHPKLQHRSETFMTRNCTTPEEYEHVYNNAHVLAVTCIGSRHPVFSKRTLDVCIVDESTQVLQCSVIRALNAAKKFILIGDPDQLPPIVTNKDALSRGLSESLFERLQSPESVITLNFNYRMNKPITQLANDLTYNGQLLIANDNVANANLRIPKIESLMAIYKERQWILQALDESLNNAVCVLDTGPVWNRNYTSDWIRKSVFKNDEEEILLCSNPSETAIVATLVHALIKGGIDENAIGVIAPFRNQVAQIGAQLSALKVDVSTVDQFQGRDKDVIIYSCAKSRDVSIPIQVSKFEILEDQRRLTVAITRSKHKFILIADVSTIREYRPFSKLFSSIQSDNYIKLMDGHLGFNWQHELSMHN